MKIAGDQEEYSIHYDREFRIIHPQKTLNQPSHRTNTHKETPGVLKCRAFESVLEMTDVADASRRYS